MLGPSFTNTWGTHEVGQGEAYWNALTLGVRCLTRSRDSVAEQVGLTSFRQRWPPVGPLGSPFFPNAKVSVALLAWLQQRCQQTRVLSGHLSSLATTYADITQAIDEPGAEKVSVVRDNEGDKKGTFFISGGPMRPKRGPGLPPWATQAGPSGAKTLSAFAAARPPSVAQRGSPGLADAPGSPRFCLARLAHIPPPTLVGGCAGAA